MTVIKYPLQIDQKGATVISNNYQESIQQNVLAILGTQRGSYGFHRSFGSRIHELIFEQNDEILQSLLYTEIKEALLQEERISVRRIQFTQSENLVQCEISYFVKSLNTNENLIFDFERNI